MLVVLSEISQNSSCQFAMVAVGPKYLSSLLSGQVVRRDSGLDERCNVLTRAYTPSSPADEHSDWT